MAKVVIVRYSLRKCSEQNKKNYEVEGDSSKKDNSILVKTLLDCGTIFNSATRPVDNSIIYP